LIVYLSAVEAVEADARAVEAEAENAYNRAVVVSSFLSNNNSALKRKKVRRKAEKGRKKKEANPSNKPSFSSERRSPLQVGSKLKEEEEEDEIVDKNMAFVAPQCRDDEDGWGPSSKGYGKEDGETGIEAIIYSPFLKTDKFGRAADWTTSGGKYNRNEQRYQREREMQHQRDFGGGGVVQ